MTGPLYLSRARLRTGRGEALSSIAPILLPDDEQHRASHAHRMVWLLFQDQPDAVRDFLWRDDGNGQLMVLSRRPPFDPHLLFELQTKPFEPELAVGDELRFVLRANPTVARKGASEPAPSGTRQRGKRVDIVMDRLHALDPKERSIGRDAVAAEAGHEWLEAQGKRSGFDVTSAVVGRYAQVDIADTHRPRRRARGGISVMDIEGSITVTEPGGFIDKLASGFGSAKAFGCGLMLIRRIR